MKSFLRHTLHIFHKLLDRPILKNHRTHLKKIEIRKKRSEIFPARFIITILFIILFWQSFAEYINIFSDELVIWMIATILVSFSGSKILLFQYSSGFIRLFVGFMNIIIMDSVSNVGLSKLFCILIAAILIPLGMIQMMGAAIIDHQTKTTGKPNRKKSVSIPNP